MKKIKFAVIGCGHIGKRHAEMIVRNNDAQLVALIDSNKNVLPSIEKYNVPFFTNLDEFLKNDIDTDVVNIATPNGLHAQRALQSLEANKHVVIEKPVALVKADAEKIIYTSLILA